MNKCKAILESLKELPLLFEWKDGDDFINGDDEFHLAVYLNHLDPVGWLTYHVNNNVPSIDGIHTDIAYQRQGIASEMIAGLMHKFKCEYKEIYWNSLYPVGLKLKEKLDNKYNLSQEEKDSNWFGMVEDTEDEWK